MLELRVRQVRSWLTSYGFSFARELGDALWQKCSGKHVLKIDLTYDRSEYVDARDLYVRQSEERHVRRFMARLSRFVGESLAGKWICKLEFQTGGWVHWHILLVDFGRKIPQEDLERVWGHGFVYIRRAWSEADIRYVAKYVGKAGCLPNWLFLERSRSVKIIRVSPGFWPPRVWPEVYQSDRAGVNYGYVSIGAYVQAAVGTIVVREDGRYREWRCDLAAVANVLRMAGGAVSGDKGWLRCDGVSLAGAERLLSRVTGRLPSAPALSGPAAAGLHLIYTPNPPSLCPAWIESILIDQLRDSPGVISHGGDPWCEPTSIPPACVAYC